MLRFLRRRRRNERGAATVELAIIAPFLALILFGSIEMGFAWRDSLTVGNSIRSGLRVSTNQGPDRMADYWAIQGMEAGLGDIPDAQVNRIVIWDVSAAGDAVPTSCQNGLPSAICNVYDSSVFNLTPADFTGTTSCTGSSPDRFFCPLTRNDDPRQPLTKIGIWMEVERPLMTGVLPGQTIIIGDQAVMTTEPNTI